MFTTTPRGGHVLDGEPEGGPAGTVDDDIEVAAELLDDGRGAEAAQQLPGRGGIADQRGDDSAAGAGELDRDAPDSAGRARDQHALAEHQAPRPPAPAALSGRRWEAWRPARRKPGRESGPGG